MKKNYLSGAATRALPPDAPTILVPTD